MLLQKKPGWKEQLEWAEKTLAAQKSETWRLVVGHHPMRSYGHYGDQKWMLSQVKPIMEEHGADVYLAGHDHDLQIIDPPEDDFVSVVTGAGGGCRSTRWGEHSVAAATGGGFVRLDMDEKALRMTIITSGGGIIGSHTVTKRTL